MRAEEAKGIQEKAAKIKEWVTLKLAEVNGKLISGSLEWTCEGGPSVAQHVSASCLWGLD